ncbi:MAG: hypothetical protein K9M11_00930 [Candidatus Pacebacteria bacterium]|nr:hypothetical protein [Candidatus Paceibacterota bacterium]
MKHALITLVIVILFVLLVVPLLYIALGKLKNPIDLFALNKVGKSGMVTKQSHFISQNYIPESSSPSSLKKNDTSSIKNIHQDAELCFSNDLIIPVSEEYFSLEKKEDARSNLRNDLTGTSYYFEDFYPTVVTREESESSRNTWSVWSSLTFLLEKDCAKHSTNISDMFVEYNDGGILLDNYIKNHAQGGGFDFTDKGITTINGRTYYRYTFEDKNRIYKEKNDTFYYSIIYSTLVGDKVVVSAFNGTSDVYGSVRDFQNQTQTFLAGTVYGTSTPGSLPYQPPSTQSTAN